MKEHYQYSKKIPIITGIIFIVMVLLIFFQNATGNYDYVNASVSISIISISGGIFGSSIIWYLKKAQVENSFKLRCMQFEKASEQRLKFIEGTLKLQKKYNVTSQQIEEIEFQNPIDEMEEESLNSLKQTVEQYD